MIMTRQCRINEWDTNNFWTIRKYFWSLVGSERMTLTRRRSVGGNIAEWHNLFLNYVGFTLSHRNNFHSFKESFFPRPHLEIFLQSLSFIFHSIRLSFSWEIMQVWSIFKDLGGNYHVLFILRFCWSETDPRLLSPTHVIHQKKQGDEPNLLGQGLGQDEAINRGHRVIYWYFLYTLLSFW